jgi:hypothetical protein
MAKKAKRRVAKRRAVPAKASKATRSRKAKAVVKAKAARPKAKAKARAKARPAKRPAVAASAERKRLLREQRALERDVENESLPSALPESAEYIPEATEDSLAEELGEAAVQSATSGDQAIEAIRDEDVSEEVGGPFVPSSARQEFAQGTDDSNPEDAEPADFPTATGRPS